MKVNRSYINNMLDSILNESQHAISDNPGYGYHGTVDPKIHNSKNKNSPLHGDDERARAHHYKKMHQTVRSVTGADAKTAKHYLDSKHGRHLADVHNDNTHRGLAVSRTHDYIKKDFSKFKKHYKPEFFESYEGEIDVENINEDTEYSEAESERMHASKYQEGSELHHHHMSQHHELMGNWHDRKGRTTLADKHYSKAEEHHSKSIAASQKMHEELNEATYTSSNFDKDNDHPSKSKNTFIKGVHGDEAEHIRTIKQAAGKISDEHAKKIAHHPDYHKHAYDHRHAFARGGSVGFDNGVKKLAGTHAHYPDKAGAIKEEVELEEMSDSGSFKAGDRVRIHAPSNPRHNDRGVYAGIERGRHVVKHADGSRSIHGAGALLKESAAQFVKSLVKEETKSADKKPEYARTPSGKLIVKLVTRKHDVVDAGGKDPGNETENK